MYLPRYFSPQTVLRRSTDRARGRGVQPRRALELMPERERAAFPRVGVTVGRSAHCSEGASATTARVRYNLIPRQARFNQPKLARTFETSGDTSTVSGGFTLGPL